jgi:hypothetical protein
VNTEEDAYLKRLADLESMYNRYGINKSFGTWLLELSISRPFYEFAMELKYDSR